MDLFFELLDILVFLGVAFVAFLGKSYFPKYVSEKAKNLATKEDVADITRQIEEVKSNYALALEKAKHNFQVKSALEQAFQSKCLEALVAVNDLLIEIHLYCWKEIAERSPNEHYVWSSVDESDEEKHFHYFRVAIDKLAMVHSLYLTEHARDSLHELSSQIGLLSSMELALIGSDPDPRVEDSAVSGYETGIRAVEKCREELISELGIGNRS